MNIIKRSFAWVLCFVIILSAFSLPVCAQGEILIESVDITVKDNLQGIPVSQWEDYITINSPGLKFLDEEGFPAAAAFSNFAQWELDSFETGNVYYLYMYFEPDEGYAFPEGVRLEDVKVNDVKPEDSFHVYWRNEDTGKIVLELCYKVEMIGDGFFSEFLYFIKTLIFRISPWLFEQLF